MYTAWSVVFGEQPTAAKWNQLGQNDAGFKDGTNFDDGIILEEHIGDGEVTPDKIDGMAWEILANEIAASPSDTITAAIANPKKFMQVLIIALNTGGTINGVLRFNSDAGNNYARRTSDNGGTDSTAASSANIPIDAGAAAAYPFMHRSFITNIQNREKLLIGHTAGQNTAGAGNAPLRREVVGKWANTAAQISSISLINSSGTGDFDTGTTILVLGTDG